MIRRLATEWVTDMTSLGSLPFYVLITVCLLSLGESTAFISLTISLILIYLVAIPIRLLFYKERPENKKRPKSYKHLIEKIDYASFPSIHSARIAAICSALGMLYRNPFFLLFLGTTLILVMVSRVLLKKHDIIDVIAGAILGIFIGMVTISFF